MERDSGGQMPQQMTRAGGGTPASSRVPITANGAVRGAGQPDDVVQQTTNVVVPRDKVRWGPIWAGLLTALGTFLLLSLLALAIGAQTVNTGAADAETASVGSGIATAIIGLLSFFLGGWVAARSATIRDRGSGLLNGFLVWALGTALILALTAF